MDKLESIAARIGRLRPARYYGTVAEIRAHPEVRAVYLGAKG